MTKGLLSALKSMDEADFICIGHHFEISKMVRELMKERGWDSNKMAEELGVKPSQMKAIRNAAYEFDLRMLSKIQALQMEMYIERAKEKVDSQFKVADYKNLLPEILHRINSLISKMEKPEP